MIFYSSKQYLKCSHYIITYFLYFVFIGQNIIHSNARTFHYKTVEACTNIIYVYGYPLLREYLLLSLELFTTDFFSWISGSVPWSLLYWVVLVSWNRSQFLSIHLCSQPSSANTSLLLSSNPPPLHLAICLLLPPNCSSIIVFILLMFRAFHHVLCLNKFNYVFSFSSFFYCSICFLYSHSLICF